MKNATIFDAANLAEDATVFLNGKKYSFPEKLSDGFLFKRSWTYRNPDGSPQFYVNRYENETGKTIRPFYIDPEDQMIMKQPPGILLQPLKSDLLYKEPNAPVLVVEGEKAATCTTAVNLEELDFIVTTLPKTIAKCDVSLLRNRTNLYYFADADQVGFKKAHDFKQEFPNAKIIPPFPEWPPGSDIADFDIDKYQLLSYFETAALSVEELEKLAGIEKDTIPKNKSLSEDLEDSFLKNPTQGAYSDLLKHNCKNVIFEKTNAAGYGDFYINESGTAYYRKISNPKVFARNIIKKILDDAFNRHKNNPDGFKNIYELVGAALKKNDSKEFITGALSFFSEEVITDDAVKWNTTAEVICCRDKVIDFSGKKPIARDSFSNEYFLNPIMFYAEDILGALFPERYNQCLREIFPDEGTLRTAKNVIALMIANKGTKNFGVWSGQAGNNAKTFLMKLIMSVLGAKAKILKSAIIMKNGNPSERRFGAFALRGITAAFVEEAEGQLDTSRVKTYQGGGTVRAEEKGLASVEFPQTWMFTILTNKLPSFAPADDLPFVDRLIVVPFNSVFYNSEEQKEKYLKRNIKPENLHPAEDPAVLMDVLKKEHPGIILGMIYDFIELREVQKGKVFESKESRDAKETYRKNNDTLENFYDEYLTSDAAGFVPTAELIDLYQEFSGKKISGAKFTKIMTDKFPFLTSRRINSKRGLYGVKLL